MRHGSTLARVASCCLLLSYVPVPAQAGDGSGLVAGSAAGWVLPAESRGERVAPILLLSRPEVQTELRLKPDQIADVARVIADARRKATQLKGRKDQAAIELRRSVDEEQRLWLETKLTEDQVGRLSEVDLQWEGLAAIATRPALAAALSLSDAQKSTLDRALVERHAHRVKPVELERDPAGVEHRFAQQVWAALNEGQRRQWEKMLGRPFTLAALTSGRSLR